MIKQMSLIALGAATLFMAPTVVHADEGTNRGTKQSDASVNIEDVPGKVNNIRSASEFSFDTVSNQSVKSIMDTKLSNEAWVKVEINESDKGWSLGVNRTSFIRTNDEGEKIEELGTEKLLFNAGPKISSPVNEENKPVSYTIPQYYSGEITSNSHEVIKAEKHSVGAHLLVFPVNAAQLNIPKYFPAGTYTSKITWTLNNTA